MTRISHTQNAFSAPIKSVGLSLLLGCSLLLAGTAFAASPPADSTVKPAASEVDANYPNRIQVALLLDTSNSMDGLINQAKSQLWTLVNELSESTYKGHAPRIELALYEYGNSNLSVSSGYVRQVLSLTTDLDDVSEKLFALSTNGGQEYAGTVLTAALNDLEWSRNSEDMKLLIIAGNEPFTQGPISYKSACALAHEKGVAIDTIHCGNEDVGIKTKWKDGADCGHGIYMVINQDEKYVHIPSPYDDQILTLNQQFNTTYIGYGALGEANKARQSAEDEKAGNFSPSAQLKRTRSKASHAYRNEAWDLVDAYEEDADAVLAMPETELPDEMKEMSEEERVTFIETKKAERETLSAEIKALEKQRTDFVNKARKDMAASQSLENVMVDAVKRQATQRGYKFDGS